MRVRDLIRRLLDFNMESSVVFPSGSKWLWGDLEKSHISVGRDIVIFRCVSSDSKIKIEELKAKIEKLVKQLKGDDSEKVKILEGKNRGLRDAQETAADGIRVLEAKIEELKEKIVEFRDGEVGWTRRYWRRGNVLEELKAKIKELKECNTEQGDEIVRLLNDRRVLENKVMRLEKGIIMNQSVRDDFFDEKIKKLEAKIKELRNAGGDETLLWEKVAADKIRVLEAKIKELEAKIIEFRDSEELRTKLYVHRGVMLEELRAKIVEQAEEIEELKEENLEQRNEIVQSSNDRKILEDRIMHLQRKITLTDQDVSVKTEKIKQLEAEIEDAKGEAEKIRVLEAKIKRLTTEVNMCRHSSMHDKAYGAEEIRVLEAKVKQTITERNRCLNDPKRRDAEKIRVLEIKIMRLEAKIKEQSATIVSGNNNEIEWGKRYNRQYDMLSTMTGQLEELKKAHNSKIEKQRRDWSALMMDKEAEIKELRLKLKVAHEING